MVKLLNSNYTQPDSWYFNDDTSVWKKKTATDNLIPLISYIKIMYVHDASIVVVFPVYSNLTAVALLGLICLQGISTLSSLVHVESL